MQKLIFLILAFFISTTSSFGFSLNIYSLDSEIGHGIPFFGIYNSSGKYTGYNVDNPREQIRNLPNFLEGSIAEGSGLEGETGHITNFIEGKLPDGTSGVYKLAIYGEELSVYKIQGIMKEQSNHTNAGVFYLSGLIDTEKVRYIQLQYTPNQPVIITRIATPDDLIDDITIASKLNLIGSNIFVSDLTKRIQAIALLKGKQKEEYQTILAQITLIFNKPDNEKFIKKEAYTILIEDLKYIINHAN